jgi:hypothetical protein
MDEATLDNSFWEYLPDCRKDARSAIDHEYFDVILKRISEDFQVSGNLFLALFFTNTEPDSTSNTVCAIDE